MSYSPTLTSTGNASNRNSNRSNVDVSSSPQLREYSERLMYFVYRQVFEAFKNRNEFSSPDTNDLNSATLIEIAEKKADEALRRSLI